MQKDVHLLLSPTNTENNRRTIHICKDKHQFMRRASDIILSCREGGDDWDDWDTVEYDKKTGKTKNIKKTKASRPKKKKSSFVITDPLGEGA